MPVPQRVNFVVEQAGEPVHKKLIENGATSQFQPTGEILQCLFKNVSFSPL
ncbi:hypothetical protein [Microcoleus sp. D3_18a_C4]|uniref:hypothetical protein n=1 Tax=Microcoleus sp. D3_18a_C4 TaxID=3055332 RepID=UPI002FD3C285